VMLSHKNVAVHSLCAIAEFGLSDKDKWLHAAPMFHLADAWATFAITAVGGKHVICPAFKPESALRLIQNEKVTLSNLIPTMLNLLVNCKEIREYNLSSLRVVLSGGAPIAPQLVKMIIEKFGCDYIQTYGMTETSPYLTVSILKEHLKKLPIEQQLKFKSKTGREFLGVSLKVVRDNGSEIEADEIEVGEIIVKGDIITKGYWKMPEETAKVFKNGWLFTGDMATIDKQGYVNIVDRKDDVIITGGENVYSIEVEHALYEHPSILEVAVIGIPDEKWGETVHAVVALKNGASTAADEIIEFAKKRLARFKVPKSVEFIDSLPKTGSGKITKQALKKNIKIINKLKTRIHDIN
ncbi:AMP-binding protein, partial [Bacteroidota bacterium]